MILGLPVSQRRCMILCHWYGRPHSSAAANGLFSNFNQSFGTIFAFLSAFPPHCSRPNYVFTHPCSVRSCKRFSHNLSNAIVVLTLSALVKVTVQKSTRLNVHLAPVHLFSFPTTTRENVRTFTVVNNKIIFTVHQVSRSHRNWIVAKQHSAICMIESVVSIHTMHHQHQQHHNC